MATTYIPLPRRTKMKWLLKDGRIAEEPPLEQSESGRRVRVMGTTTSVYQKDLDDLVYRSVRKAAMEMGTEIWMRVENDDPVQELDDIMGSPQRITSPHFVNGSRSRISVVSWTFRHETLPIGARITVKMEKPWGSYGYRNSNSTESVTVKVTFPSTHPDDGHSREWIEASKESEFTFSRHGGDAQQQQNFVDWMRENKPEWFDVLGKTGYQNERAAAAGVARLVRDLESLDEVSIPDLRDPTEPSWLALKLHSTSYSREFAESLVDFINGQPVVEQIQEHWSAIVDLLRRAGIVVEELVESDFHAMLQGEKERVNVTTRNIAAPDEEGGKDNKHVVGFNLATGTITVACEHRDAAPEAIATEYEIARIKAEAKGELDAFLGYQANILNSQHDDRFQRAVRQRTVDDDVDELLGIQ